MTDQDQLAAFSERLARGEKIEAGDWMPDDYRRVLLKFIQMHGLSEIMGALPEKEWVPRAPSLHRKLALMAKVQDEVGHGQLLLRVAEDLAAPLGRSRDDLVEDLFTGRCKFHNVFHMPAPTWADAGVIGWLVDGAAIITQGALLESSYAPYARVLQRVCAEEGFHIQHGESICLTLAEGTPTQRQMLQEAIYRWWEPLMHFFGPRDTTESAALMLRYRFRTKTNEELRQKFLAKFVPRIWTLGLTVPDPDLHFDKVQGQWVYTQPDWNGLRRIAANQGPLSQARLELRRMSYEEGRWVRAVLAVRGPAAA